MNNINISQAVLNLPDKLKNNQLFSLKELQFSVTGTVFPEISINNESLRFAGQTMNVPGYTRPIYSDLIINYKIDNQWLNYLGVYNWMNLFNDSKESVMDLQNILNLNSSNISKKYKYLVANQTIIALDEYDKKILKLTYTDAYPVKLKNIDFDYSKGDEIDCSAIFKFNQFHIDLYQ